MHSRNNDATFAQKYLKISNASKIQSSVLQAFSVHWSTPTLIDDNSMYTDKKENKIFLIYKEIQSGAVAKSYMRKCFLIYEEMRKYFPIYEEAVSYIWLQLLHSEFPYIWGKFDFLFYQCRKEKEEEETVDHTKERQQGSKCMWCFKQMKYK
jgi:hypothetical protein